MLNVNPETVCFLIEKARKFHAKEEVVIPEEPLSPSDSSALAVLADHRDDPAYSEFVTAVNDLEPDQQVELVALMWLGRGDFDVTEWQQARAQAGESWTAHTADYLIATPLVADYLEEGLAQLGYTCEE
jgi:hypothetical protein